MINKKILFGFFYCNIVFSMSELINIGSNLLFGSIAAAAKAKAEVQELTKGYKEEIINTQKAMTNIIEKEKAKTNNLLIISSIKNYLIQKIESNKNENGLVIDPLTKIIYTSYKKFYSIIKELKIKYKKLSSNKDKNSTLIKLAILVINSTFTEYISLLKQYNYQIQNVNQKIQTNNKFN